MAINLFEAVKNLKLTKFEFVSSQKMATSAKVNDDGSMQPSSFYLRLELKDPIDSLVAQSTMFDPATRTRVPIVVEDVTHVSVYADKLEGNTGDFTDIVFDETQNSFSGKYEGDLFFDVSQSDEVWLTDERFQDFGMKSRNDKKAARLNIMRDRLKGKGNS